MLRTSQLLLWLALLLILVGGFYGTRYFLFNSSTGGNNIALYPDIAVMSKAKIEADKAPAIALYEKIKTDPARSSDEKALAGVVIAGVTYIQSGDISARLQEIQNLKASVRDETVSPSVRAAALSVLGKEYGYSGRNPDIFKEVYKDAPFNEYLVAKDPDRSTINIEKASYGMYKSTVAAITIAQTAASLDFLKKNTSPSITAADVALAEEYLQKADAAAVEDSQDNPDYTNSDRYIAYVIARANTIGKLAVTKGEPYKSSYRHEFDSLINLLLLKHRPLPDEAVLNARFTYARVLQADKDTQGEKVQLDEMARILNGLSNPNLYSFVLLVKNEHSFRPNGVTWMSIKSLFAQSPDFEAAVTKLISVSSQ